MRSRARSIRRSTWSAMRSRPRSTASSSRSSPTTSIRGSTASRMLPDLEDVATSRQPCAETCASPPSDLRRRAFRARDQGEASARRSVSRVLSCAGLRRSRDGHPSGPPVARRLLRPTRGLGSAPLPRRRSPGSGLRPPIWPCSGWSLPVSLRSSARAIVRHRHCGTGPRLTAGGRYPPPCAAELGLSSRHRRSRPHRRRATIRPPR